MEKDHIKMKFAGIYAIVNIINNKRYVGSSKNIYRRWLQHSWDFRNFRHHNDHMQKAWNKYGENSFKLILLERVDYCDNIIEVLENKEKYYIDKYRTRDSEYGYNETDGGVGAPGRKISSDTKDKISKSNKGRKMSEDSRKRMSLAGLGRKHSPETRAKMSKTRTGKPVPKLQGRPCPEHVKETLRELFTGRHVEQAVCDKISTNKTGIKPNMDSSSKYVGVSKRGENKWISYISVNKRRVYLGTFDSEISAAMAYNKKAIESFGVNAKLNNI